MERFLRGAFLLVLLAGCAGKPPVPQGELERYWQQHRQKLGTMVAWELSARFSIQLEEEGWNAALQWRQEQDQYNIRVAAPFGRGTVEVSGDDDEVILRTPENRIYKNDDVDLLVQENLGWELPVSFLAFWIRGLPAPGTGHGVTGLDDAGRLSYLSQSGWTVRYGRYTSSYGFDVPQRMTVEGGGLKLRLSIHEWKIRR